MTDSLIGFLAGAAGGMGIGGGGILLLYLTAFCGIEQLSAQGTNLLFFLATAPVAVFFHFKNGFIKIKNAAVTAAFGIPGVFLGFFIAQNIGKDFLRVLFALLLIFIGARELFRKG